MDLPAVIVLLVISTFATGYDTSNAFIGRLGRQNHEKIYDDVTGITALKDHSTTKCYVQLPLQPNHGQTQHYVTPNQLQYIAGPTISNFCNDYPTYLITTKSTIKKRSTQHYFSGRRRGQTQSQYLNFGSSHEPGKAEAEFTVDGSRAVVTGSSGMGQAQSQGGTSDCGDCRTQEQTLHYGRPGGGDVGAERYVPGGEIRRPGEAGEGVVRPPGGGGGYDVLPSRQQQGVQGPSAGKTPGEQQGVSGGPRRTQEAQSRLPPGAAGTVQGPSGGGYQNGRYPPPQSSTISGQLPPGVSAGSQLPVDGRFITGAQPSGAQAVYPAAQDTGRFSGAAPRQPSGTYGGPQGPSGTGGYPVAAPGTPGYITNGQRTPGFVTVAGQPAAQQQSFGAPPTAGADQFPGSGLQPGVGPPSYYQQQQPSGQVNGRTPTQQAQFPAGAQQQFAPTGGAVGGYPQQGQVTGGVTGGGYPQQGQVTGGVTGGGYPQQGQVTGGGATGGYPQQGQVTGGGATGGYPQQGQVTGGVTGGGYPQQGQVTGGGYPQQGQVIGGGAQRGQFSGQFAGNYVPDDGQTGRFSGTFAGQYEGQRGAGGQYGGQQITTQGGQYGPGFAPGVAPSSVPQGQFQGSPVPVIPSSGSQYIPTGPGVGQGQPSREGQFVQGGYPQGASQFGAGGRPTAGQGQGAGFGGGSDQGRGYGSGAGEQGVGGGYAVQPGGGQYPGQLQPGSAGTGQFQPQAGGTQFGPSAGGGAATQFRPDAGATQFGPGAGGGATQGTQFRPGAGGEGTQFGPSGGPTQGTQFRPGAGTGEATQFGSGTGGGGPTQGTQFRPGAGGGEASQFGPGAGGGGPTQGTQFRPGAGGGEITQFGPGAGAPDAGGERFPAGTGTGPQFQPGAGGGAQYGPGTGAAQFAPNQFGGGAQYGPVETGGGQYGPGAGAGQYGGPAGAQYGPNAVGPQQFPDQGIYPPTQQYGQAIRQDQAYPGGAGYETTGGVGEDDSDSQAQSSVQQVNNETQAVASAQGTFGGGTAQSQVQGTYFGTGSFTASAGTSDGRRGAQTQISGGDSGVMSSAQGTGGLGQSQAQVLLSSETGETTSNAQSGGYNHGTNSQVQANEKGGMADAQANGPGNTSSQAQIGFTPYNESDADDQETPFKGGGTASAQGGAYSGQTQSQITGKFRFGIKYTGSAQAQSGGSQAPGNVTAFKPFTPLSFVNLTKQTHSTDRQNFSGGQLNKNLRQPVTTTTLRYEAGQGGATAPDTGATSETPEYYDENEYDEDYEDDDKHKIGTKSITQVSGKQKQHIILDPLEDLDANVHQAHGNDDLKHGMVLQPGQHIPGSSGYRIPQGFRGKVISLANGAHTAAFGPNAQAQSVTLKPGSGKVIYARPLYQLGSRTHLYNGNYGYGSGYTYQPTTYKLKSGKSLPNFVAVTKSETGSQDLYTGKRTPSVYYSQSSTCGYFTNTCVFNGKTKVCTPKPKTNPDGTPVIC